MVNRKVSDASIIPNHIHYIWLGCNSLDKTSQKCIESWGKLLPEYQITCWDDKKCKDIIAKNTYAREAWQAKKYAFVSDYLRLYILYNYGGVYMDTDVEIVKNIDCFLSHSAFTCFESKEYILTALLGAEKGSIWVKMLLEDYENRTFINGDGTYDLTTNVMRITQNSYQWGFQPTGQYQVLQGDVHIYTKDYFCPLDTKNSRKNCFTENTYAIHLYNGSWTPKWRRMASKVKKKLGIDPRKLLGDKLYSMLRKQ